MQTILQENQSIKVLINMWLVIIFVNTDVGHVRRQHKSHTLDLQQCN